MFAFFRIDRPTNATLRPDSIADVCGLLHPVHVRRERRDEDPPGPVRDDHPERLADDALRLREAGPLGVGRVSEQEVDAAVPDLGELADVGALAVHRRVVELVVAGVDDASARRLQHDRGRVGDRVRHADQLDPERAELHRRIVRRHLAQLRLAQEPVLVQLRLHETERQPGGDDDGHVHLAHQVRQPADMVLVAVREHDGADHRLALLQIRDVAEHEVDAEVLVAREREAGVDDDDRIVRLVDGHVLPDLAQPAERDDPADTHPRSLVASTRAYADAGWSTPPRTRHARTCSSSSSVGSTIGSR